MWHNMVRHASELNLADREAQFAERLAPQLVSPALPMLAITVPVVGVPFPQVSCQGVLRRKRQFKFGRSKATAELGIEDVARSNCHGRLTRSIQFLGPARVPF